MDIRSEKLKEIILQKYPSVRAFAQEAGIPHGTLVSALNNGIDGMAWAKLNRICQCLEIDAESLEPLYKEESGITDAEKRLLAYYNLLNGNGRAKVEEYIRDISRITDYERAGKEADKCTK